MAKFLASSTGTANDAYWLDESALPSGLEYWGESGQDFVPDNSGTQDIGSTTRVVANIYAEGFYLTDGSSGVSSTVGEGSIVAVQNPGNNNLTVYNSGGFFSGAYVYAYSGSANHVTCTSGSIAFGVFIGASEYAYITAEGMASLAHGATLNDDYTSLIRAAGSGSAAHGNCQAYGANAKIEAYGHGSRAFGYCVNGTIESTGNGAWAFGAAYEGTITAGGDGSFAHGLVQLDGVIQATNHGAWAFGYAKNGTIRASGRGSIAMGYAYGQDIIASATGAMQFGAGTNTLASSAKFGSGVRFVFEAIGTVNGDIWSDGTNVYIFSGGAARNCSNM